MNENTFISTAVTLNWTPGNTTVYNFKLYSSSSADQPEYVHDSDCDYIRQLPVNFANVSLKKYPWKRVNNKKIVQLSLEIEVLLGAKEGVLRFRVKIQNRVIGERELDFSKN